MEIKGFQLKDLQTILNIFSDICPYKSPDFNNRNVIEFWYTALKHLDLDKIDLILKKLIIKNIFPSIDVILRLSDGRPTHEKDEAILIATNIIRVAKLKTLPDVKKCIPAMPYSNEKCNETVGVIGSKVVSDLGGWHEIRENWLSPINLRSLETMCLARLRQWEYRFNNEGLKKQQIERQKLEPKKAEIKVAEKKDIIEKENKNVKNKINFNAVIS